MFQAPLLAPAAEMSGLLDRLAQTSSRPRYAFMLLSLIAEVTGPNGEAGPLVHRQDEVLSLRDYLCDSLAPLGGRDPRRAALADRVKADLEKLGGLPDQPAEAAAVLDEEVRKRVRASGKTNLSRAVSELVKAGLLHRYYKGYAVDHENRGAQRTAVYVLQGQARCLLKSPRELHARRPEPRQGLLL